jgi:hypothetical protein
MISPYKDYSSLLGGKLTMFAFCNYRFVLAKVSRVILRLLFYCLWCLFWLFVTFIEILGLRVFILLFMIYFIVCARSLGASVGMWVLVRYGHEWAHECWSFMGMCEGWWLLDPSSVGTLTFIKMIETFVESTFITECVWPVVASYIFCFGEDI